MIQCTECFIDNPDGAQYCNHCGRRLFVQKPRLIPPTEQPPMYSSYDPYPPIDRITHNESPAQSTEPGWLSGVGYGLILAMVHFLILVAVFMSGRDPVANLIVMGSVAYTIYVARQADEGKNRKATFLASFAMYILLWMVITSPFVFYFAGINIARKTPS